MDKLRKIKLSRDSKTWLATLGTLAVVFTLAMFIDGMIRSHSPNKGPGERPSWMGRQPRSLLAAGQKADSYALVIDAGSSGSRVHVYKLGWEEGRAIPKVQLPDQKLKVKPGLSSFVGKEDQAGASLEPLIKFAMEKVPEEVRKETRVILSATAGLRMVPKESADKILDSCYKFLKSSGFKVERSKVSVISGADEGALGWLTINYLMERLKGMPKVEQGTVGGIEMGGASAQVTFLNKDSNAKGVYKLQVGSEVYPLYTHSYLGFGQEEARNAVNKGLGDAAVDPCMPKGYTKEAGKSPAGVYGGPEGKTEGGGDFDECRKRARAIMDKKEACDEEPCTFGGVHQPPIKDAGELIVFENFYHTANNVGITGKDKGVSPNKFAEYGRKFCGQPWDVITAKGADAAYPSMDQSPGSAEKTCFSLAYLGAFLQHGLNLPEDVPVPVMGNVGGADIEWALGQLLVEVTSGHAVVGGDTVEDRQQALKAQAGVVDVGRRESHNGGSQSSLPFTGLLFVFVLGIAVMLFVSSRSRKTAGSASSYGKSVVAKVWREASDLSAASPYSEEVDSDDLEAGRGKEH